MPDPTSQARPLSRREFLKFSGLNLAALFYPAPGDHQPASQSAWPALRLEDLPREIIEILAQTPSLRINARGYMFLAARDGSNIQPVQLAPTQWNLEHQKRWNRLDQRVPWALVLHWYGDRGNYEDRIESYLGGFNSLRQVGTYQTRTSAHYLVGNSPVSLTISDSEQTLRGAPGVSVVQIQEPDVDGIPFAASHLQSLNMESVQEQKHYFVRAIYQLGHEMPGFHSVLSDWFEGVRLDPNLRSIAVEICGFKFDEAETYPSAQKIANVLAVVWAIMKRYAIPVTHLLGHHEIQLGKADPGKQFMATIRYLLGVKALVERDPLMRKLVFGHLIGTDGYSDAVKRYFQLVRRYFVLTGTQREIFEWEQTSKYWFVYHQITQGQLKLPLVTRFSRPVGDQGTALLDQYLRPEGHEGLDLVFPRKRPILESIQAPRAHLAAGGICLYQGEFSGVHYRASAIFQHYLENGAQVLSIFGNLIPNRDLVVGASYPAGYPVGEILLPWNTADPFLHFALAYGATWDTDLGHNRSFPLNAGENWIRSRFLDPLDYLATG